MNHLPYSDSSLLQAYIKGNEEAFATLLNRHKNKVFNFIMSKVLDEQAANDIFQETFIKVIQTLKTGQYQEEGKFSLWLMRVAFNCTMDYFRQQSKHKALFTVHDENLSHTVDFLEFTIEEDLINEQISEDLKLLVEALPESQREVLEMRLYRNMSFKEISIAINISINTVIGRMRYALQNLRKTIEDRNIILTA